MTEERDREPTDEKQPSEMTREELSAWAAEQRKASYERTRKALRSVLSNEAGFARIEAISDEEWDRAQTLDDEDEAREADRGAA